MRSRIFSRATRVSVLAALAVTARRLQHWLLKPPSRCRAFRDGPKQACRNELRRPEQPSSYSGPSLSEPGYAQAAPSANNGYDANCWRNPQPSYAAQPSYQPQYQPTGQAIHSSRPINRSWAINRPTNLQGSYQPQSYQPQPSQPRWQPGLQARAYGAPITSGLARKFEEEPDRRRPPGRHALFCFRAATACRSPSS